MYIYNTFLSIHEVISKPSEVLIYLDILIHKYAHIHMCVADNDIFAIFVSSILSG